MTPQTIGLYVHLPWCERKCPYCDFNSYELRGTPGEARYVAALLADLEAEIAFGEPPSIGSIFFGGGTPSLFSGAAVARLLDGIARRLTLTPDVEITLEANPGSAEAARFAAYRAAGVNRLSLGVQSFDDASLAALGRVHSAQQAVRAIESLGAAGFTNFNLDLMFGLPGARAGDALTDLERALEFMPPHLSWYQLTLEEGTAFARHPPALPGHDAICDDYDAGLGLLTAAGYTQYEISAHARAGAQARHNLNYWCFGDYIGIGAGAHGKRSREGSIWRRSKVRHPEHYMKAALAGTALAEQSAVVGARRVTEFMLNALRLRSGFRILDLSRGTGLSLSDEAVAGPLAEGIARGWLERDADVVRPTALGFRFLNDLQLIFVSAEEAQSATVGT